MPKQPEIHIHRFAERRCVGMQYRDSWTCDQLIELVSVRVLGGKLEEVTLGNQILYQSDTFAAGFGRYFAIPGQLIEVFYSGYDNYVRCEIHYTIPVIPE